MKGNDATKSRSQDFNPPPRKGCGTSLFTIDQVKSDRDYGWDPVQVNANAVDHQPGF
jgi:hypothetical protein